jgi:cell wall-active antibiotic response 4TMS protein YvqF
MATSTPSDRPPPPPPQGASREEWREWRRSTRRYHRGGPGWTWFWGLALIVAGAYFLLKNVGLLDWVRGDILWPVLLIALGVWLLIDRMAARPPG